jgi:serine/threonine-protein kinase RsbW
VTTPHARIPFASVAPDIFQITIPSRTSRLEDVRLFVATKAHEAGFSDTVIEQLVLAVDEACTNVIKHAYGGSADELIGVTIRVLEDRLEIAIQDTGHSFDRADYRTPDLTDLAQQRRRGGLGVHIMHQLMDSVEYRRTNQLNEVVMTKRRNKMAPNESK